MFIKEKMIFFQHKNDHSDHLKTTTENIWLYLLLFFMCIDSKKTVVTLLIVSFCI